MNQQRQNRGRKARSTKDDEERDLDDIASEGDKVERECVEGREKRRRRRKRCEMARRRDCERGKGERDWRSSGLAASCSGQ
jgi:hypothetical protein